MAELDKMTSARDEQRKHHDDLRKQRLNDFMEGWVDFWLLFVIILVRFQVCHHHWEVEGNVPNDHTGRRRRA